MMRFLSLDVLGEAAFQKNTAGIPVFFPYGPFTKGFIAHSNQIHRELIWLQKWWTIITLSIGIPMGIAELHWAIQAPVLIGLNLLQYYSIRNITKTLSVSPERWRVNPPK